MATGNRTEWVDSHVHVWTDDRTKYPRKSGTLEYAPVRFTPDDFLCHARLNGVTRAVLVQVSFYGTDNSYLLDSIRAHPGVFSGIAIIDHEVENAAVVMAELAQQGIRGFRILPKPSGSAWLESPAMAEIWRCAAEQCLAICPLVNPDALPAIDSMCDRFPETPVVIDHLARIGADGLIREEDVRLLCKLARHPQSYVKVSATYALGRKQPPYTDLLPMIKRVFDAWGPRRLMWGSDSPFQTAEGHGYRESLALITDHLQFLSAQDRDGLLRKTAESIFFSPRL